MADPMFAFLFEHFCLEGKESTRLNLKYKSSLYVLEIESELKTLQAEAQRALPEPSTP